MEIVADRIDPSTPRDLAMFTAMPFRRFLGLNQAKLIIDDATTCGIDEIIRWALPAGLRIRADRPITTPFADPALRMVGIDHRLYRRIGDHDLLLVEPTSGAIVGVHVYHTLAIAPAFRGLGLGPELLIEHILRGGSHVSVDIFGNVLFNHAGVENRRRAHALLRDTAWRERKQQTLASAKPQAVKIDLRPFGGEMVMVEQVGMAVGAVCRADGVEGVTVEHKP